MALDLQRRRQETFKLSTDPMLVDQTHAIRLVQDR